jgi:hypothetical protein
VSDLIERLRRYSDQLGGITGEAADEIESLVARVDSLTKATELRIKSEVFRNIGERVAASMGPLTQEIASGTNPVADFYRHKAEDWEIMYSHDGRVWKIPVASDEASETRSENDGR